MTRVEAYKCMLEGKQIEHHMLPGAIWRLDADRIVRTNTTSSDWGREFFSMVCLADGWKIYDKS